MPDLERQFVWTAIPSGRVADGEGVLAVLLTPRLLGPADQRLTVADFGMQTWPEHLAGLQFDVAVSGGATVRARRMPFFGPDSRPVSYALETQLAAWTALFGVGLRVRPYGPTDYGKRAVRRFPAADAARGAAEHYGDVATAHVRHAEDPVALDGALRTARDSLQRDVRFARGQSGTTGRGATLAQAYDFYRRQDHPDYTPVPDPGATAPEEPEFHAVVARLADHPLLLRSLGLIVDLAISETVLASGSSLRVAPVWPPDAANATPPRRDITPLTGYERDAGRFVPMASARVQRGMLRVGGAGMAPAGTNADWEIVPFDVDGAVLRLIGALEAGETDAAATNPHALPTLRSAGFGLAQRDREQAHYDRVRRAAQLADADELADAILDAEDLLGGYRIDVLDDRTGTWRSLCERRVRYAIADLDVRPQDAGEAGELDEAFVRPHGAATGAGANDALYLHETVARWDGWSLAVPRPDRPVATGPDASRAPQEVTAESRIEPEPGSLPRLRFGRIYHLRVRAADITGGGLRLDEPGHDEQHTLPCRHGRFEPVPPPELVPTADYPHGATPARLVIRSDGMGDVAAYAARYGQRPYDQRLLLAPRASLDFAIQHEGTFDEAIGDRTSPDTLARFFELVRHADGELLDIPGARLSPATPAPGVPSSVVVPEDGVELPWLADPLAIGVALRPGSPPHDAATNLPCQVAWTRAWPDRPPLPLRLVEAASGAAVRVAEDGGAIHVALGPAEELTLAVSSFLDAERVDLLGVAAWLPEGTSDAHDIATGAHPMLTPPRTITLVHAVQRPRAVPSGVLRAEREENATTAQLKLDGLLLNRASTAQIDVHGAWTETEDLPGAPPAPRGYETHVGSLDVTLGPLDLDDLVHSFGDTRHRDVSYTVTAVSRFASDFEDRTAVEPDACLLSAKLAATNVPSSQRPPAPKVRYVMPAFGWERTTVDPATVHHIRRGGRLRVYLDRPWYVSGADEALAVLTLATSTKDSPQTWPFLSAAGRDPAWITGNPPGLLHEADVETPTGDAVVLSEAAQPVGVRSHAVTYDPARDLWFADVDLGALVSAAYFPFVQLSLARYQPSSISARHRLSPAVRAEPIQLPPHRSLTVTQSRDAVSFSLDGLGPNGPVPNTVRGEVQILADGPGLAPRPAPQDPDAAVGWETLTGVDGGLATTLALPALPRIKGRPLRLLVTEHEAQRRPEGTSPTGPERMVFADTVALTPADA